MPPMRTARLRRVVSLPVVTRGSVDHRELQLTAAALADGVLDATVRTPVRFRVRDVRGVPPIRWCERVVVVRSRIDHWIGSGGVLEADRFSVRKVRHGDGSQSYWIFTPDLQLHRPSLNVLCRYQTSTQQTYAYSLVDHLNWLLVNGKTPDTVTLDDLRRYMNGVTGQLDGVYGAAWRKPTQKPMGASAAGNVASVVKARGAAMLSSIDHSRFLVCDSRPQLAGLRGSAGSLPPWQRRHA